MPRGLKPQLILWRLTARLEAAPFQTRVADQAPPAGLRFVFPVRWGVRLIASSALPPCWGLSATLLLERLWGRFVRCLKIRRFRRRRIASIWFSWGWASRF